ncbi:biotin/lipoyl-binding carrier protein [Paracoccaceae bacterium]|nr:biotin/lipoyl-binding carrier protein [Paracoccaceae bacterium]
MKLFKVVSETAGTIFRIERNSGDTVDEGDVILILESMKMEIEILAEKKGVIKNILVEEGDLVQEGQHLADIEAS